MLSFEHTEFFLGLLLLIPLVLIFVFVLQWKRKVRNALGDEALINRLTKDYSPKLYRLKFIAVLCALAFCILASTNLRKPDNNGKEETAGIDVMIALDVSKSMLSNDIKPSRLERAKQLASAIIDRQENNRVGMVVFAGEAFLQMPLTPDINEAHLYLSNASPDAVPVQGTNISAALQLCNNSLDTKEKKHKAIILISDGEDHDNSAEATTTQLNDDGVVVYTVGIGTAEGSTIMEPGAGSYKTDIDGKTVISKLNEEELKAIAAKTGGNYFYMDDATTTETQVNNALGSIEKKLIEGTGEKTYFSFAPFIIAVALILLVAEIFIPEKIMPRKKTTNKKVTIAVTGAASTSE